MGEGSIAVAPSVSCVRDTCNVYVLRRGADAVLVDFGSGDVLDRLAELGVERVTDVLITHHHRDQVQGLARAAEAGIRIWAPRHEIELIAGMDDRWRRRQTLNDYDLREDRFSLLESVPVTGALPEYRTTDVGGFAVYALPTPGHTLGSVSYFVQVDGRKLAFTGDLIGAGGRVWSLAATQWTYGGVEGLGASIASAHVVAKHAPDVLLPAHGEAIEDPADALSRLAERLQRLIDLRSSSPWNARERIEQPFAEVLPHLLRNRTMFATSYVLLSETGKALCFDFGYDVTTTAMPTERAARRTVLWSIEGLDVEVAIPTHYHDDHVAGLNLLREVTGAEVWAPANVAPIIEDPLRHDLPCLWFDPIPVDRVLELEAPFTWHEYEITTYALPGHTRYAAGFLVEVDGRRVFLAGDQQTDEGDRSLLNYQYRNRFTPEDFVRSAELYRRTRPELILGGHWLPFELTDERLEQLARDADRLVALHDELLAPDGPGVAGFCARIEPYRSQPGTTEFSVWVRNPLDEAVTATLSLDGLQQTVDLDARGETTVPFTVTSEAPRRLGVDVTFGERRYGIQAEAIVE